MNQRIPRREAVAIVLPHCSTMRDLSNPAMLADDSATGPAPRYINVKIMLIMLMALSHFEICVIIKSVDIHCELIKPQSASSKVLCMLLCRVLGALLN